jgi:hypothetical protein
VPVVHNHYRDRRPSTPFSILIDIFKKLKL